MNIHILATCLSAKHVKAVLLVFKTIRIGFPKSDIFLYGNNLDPRVVPHLEQAISGLEIHFRHLNSIAHGEWIEKLIQSERKPFWICDTDIVLFDEVENWKFDLFGGRYEPQFIEPWTKTVHVSRLHPSLMYLDPVEIRSRIRVWPGTNDFFSTVEMNMFRWHWVPEIGSRTKFYDTCAGLHHAIGGTAFSEEQNTRFAHLFCGSYAHLTENYSVFENDHKLAFDYPDSTRRLWKNQQAWYEEHAV